IEKKWIGLENVRQLLGFRSIVDDASVTLFAAYIASYALLIGGVIASLVYFARKARGVRLAGWIAAVLGVGLVAHSIIVGAHAGWALCGVTILFGSFFFVLDADSDFAGIAVVGPILMIVGVIAARALKAPFLEQWEPT